MILLKYNTRFAPSPTGNAHLGNIRTAYLNWLAARASGGEFILRIDDTDKERNKQEYVDNILETMDWLGLDYDRIVYQSDRFDRYKEVAQSLVNSDQATELTNWAVGLFTDMIPSTWTDEVIGDIIVSEQDAKNSGAIILLRKDGTPTYHFASVVDDIDMGVNYIIRGHDHISNVPKHISLYRNLGVDIPKFAHVGLIHHKKKKLSKRDDAASMLFYRDAGYDPDAMLNFMLKMGWGIKNEGKEHKVIDREFALNIFFDGHMNIKAANMDLNMLEAYDRKYKAKKKVWRNKDTLSEE